MPYDFSTWDRNCNKELDQPIQGDVSGSIPPWLRGSFLLNGPGIQKYGEQEFNHVFDGSAVFQKFCFSETGITYFNRFLRSYAYAANSEHKQVVVSEFGTVGTSTGKGALQKLGDKFQFDRLFSDNAPITIIKLMGHHYAITESPFLHRIDPNTLETLLKYDLHKDLGINSHCPHPWEMPDGTTITILHNVGATGPKYDIVQFPETNPNGGNSISKPKKIGSVDARWKLNPCHMHTFAVTDNYVVLFEQPLTIDVKAMVANTVNNRPFIGGMEWKNDKMVKYHLVSRSTGKRLKFRYKSDPFFYNHIVNAYEEDGHVVVDVAVFDKPDILHALTLKKIREDPAGVAGTLTEGQTLRIVLPINVPEKTDPSENLVKLSSSTCTAHHQKDGVVLIKPEVLLNVSYETPSMNPTFRSKKYRYFYGVSGELGDNYGKIGKVDTTAKECKTWHEPNSYPATCVFVPRTGSEKEDDGVLLVNTLYGGPDKRSTARLVVLDASDMTEIASVNYVLPSDAPRALHSIYLPE